MKLFTKYSGLACLIMLISFFSCEKEAIKDETLYSEKAQHYFQTLEQAEQEADVSFGLTIADIEAALAEPLGYPKVEVCCYTASDLTFFNGCWQATTSPCLDDWDFDGNGIIGTGDLLVLLANYGCPTVEAKLILPPSLFVYNQADGMIQNETLIDGVAWYDNYGTDIFDAVRWYYDGVPVSTNPTHLQLEYPGSTDHEASIDCNSGNHLIELFVRVDCEVYSTSFCIKLGIDEPVPTCSSNYCF